MNELNISIVLISETWLRDTEDTDRLRVDLEQGHDVGVIAKNRPRKRNGSYVVGSGVAIIFSKQQISLKDYTIKKQLRSSSGRRQTT